MARRGAQTSQRRSQAAPPPAAPAGIGAAGAAPATLAAASALAAAFLAASLSAVALIAACKKILAGLGVSILIIIFLGGFAFARLPEPQSLGEPGPAEEEQRRLAAAYRAWYILNAVERLEKADAKGAEAAAAAARAEAGWFRLHLFATRNRIEAARIVDQAADRYGLLLGWQAVNDQRTTAECRAASGKNFRADHEPAIGYPGAVHPHCRCFPVPPFPGAPVLI